MSKNGNKPAAEVVEAAVPEAVEAAMPEAVEAAMPEAVEAAMPEAVEDASPTEVWVVAKAQPIFDYTEGRWFSQGVPRPVSSDNAFVTEKLESGELELFDPSLLVSVGG